MKLKNKLLTLFLAIFIFPLNVFAYSKYLIPGGESVGIRLESKGVIIVGFYKVNGEYIGSDSGLKIGDRIILINDKTVSSVEDLVKDVNGNEDTIILKIGYMSNNRLKYTTLKLVKDSDGVYKTGLYVKDSISGIGTLTYIDPETRMYGALGHEITEKTSNLKIEVKDGSIYKSIITGIDKSRSGSPGEKNARVFSSITYGDVKINGITGVFGNYSSSLPNKKLMKVASPSEIKLGKAEMLTVLSGEKVESFEINILSIDKDNSIKNILFEVTDSRLLDITGGIIQGMSGSPIIQNDMIVGAVTHVVISDAKKGYGIFITNMLDSVNE